MKKLFYTLLPFALAISSCKKKEFPQNVSEDPAFYIHAKIDGNPVSLNAGMLGYYMFSDHKQDSNGLYSFIAEMKPSTCTGSCLNSIKIEINDNRTSAPNGSSNISNSLKTGDYSFMSTSATTPTFLGYAVQYRSSFNRNALSYEWEFGDGSVSSEANPTHIYTSAGNYNVCLSIYDGVSISNICNTIKVNTNASACRTTVSVTTINGNTVQFGQKTSGTQPFSYVWDFGDGYYSTQANPLHAYPSSGLYLAKLKVGDASGDSTVYNYHVNTDLSYKSAPNFSVGSISSSYSNPITELFSKIKISYIDQNGITYSSETSQQPSTSSFIVQSVEEFKANSKNQTTKKLLVKFSCKLNNGSNFVNITDGEAVIAVSYK
jgi:PKD repeat protein